jgi:hypothetical protein
MCSEFSANIGHQTIDTNEITGELTSTIMQNRNEVDEQIAKLSETVNTVKSDFAKHKSVSLAT